LLPLVSFPTQLNSYKMSVSPAEKGKIERPITPKRILV